MDYGQLGKILHIEENIEHFLEQIIFQAIHIPSPQVASIIDKPDPFHMVFLGGSITMGYRTGGVLSESFPKLTADCIKTLYPGKMIEYQNLGYSSYNSHLGLLTAAKEAQEDNNCFTPAPDLICVEFAVNDSFELEGVLSFESLLYHLMKRYPDARLVIINAVNKEDYTCEPFMKELAVLSQIPTISIKDALKEMESVGLSWADYSNDLVHPDENGHKLIAACLLTLLIKGFQKPVPGPVTYGNTFMNTRFYDASNPPDKLQTTGFTPGTSHERFLTGWSYSGKQDTTPSMQTDTTKNKKQPPSISFSFDGSYLYLIYLQHSIQELYGVVSVEIDGVARLKLNGYSIFSWGNPSVQLINGLSMTSHEVRISILPSDIKKSFSLLGLGFSSKE